MEKNLRIAYFDNLDYGEYADLVSCPHCEMGGEQIDVMLVPFAMENCPICGENTVWAFDDVYDVKLDEVLDKYEIVKLKANYREEYNKDTDETKLIKIDEKGNDVGN